MKRINLMMLAFVLLFLSTIPLYMDNSNGVLSYISLCMDFTATILFVGIILSFILNKKGYDYKTHGDFKKYFDSKMKRNYWVLGYFGGGGINISDADILAREYAKECKVPYENVKIDEIFKSRRFKGFKYIYSTDEQIPNIDAEVMDDVFKWLND